MVAFLAIALAVAATSVAPPRVFGTTGPYTLPFFNPVGINQPYGCTGVTAELPYGPGPAWPTYCAHFHNGIDYATGSTAYVVSSRSGRVVAVKEDSIDGQSCGLGANYVLIDHLDGHWTVYLHVKLNSVVVNVNNYVSAGQRIATSGSTGCVTGAHLHYGYFTNVNFLNTDYSHNPEGNWTTTTGKVPWRAAYVSEHSPSGYTKMKYSTWTTWVYVRNDGGRTWSQTNDAYGRGRVWLGSVTNTGGTSRASTFYVSGNWISPTNTGVADTNNVSPGQWAYFTFNLYASQTGTYTEWFNLGAEGLTYFNYAYFGNYYIPITVTPCC